MPRAIKQTPLFTGWESFSHQVSEDPPGNKVTCTARWSPTLTPPDTEVTTLSAGLNAEGRPPQCPSVLPVAGSGDPRPTPPETLFRQKTEVPPYQVCHHLLHVFCAFLHLILGPSELNNIAFLCWVWKIDDNLEQMIGRSSSIISKDWTPQYGAPFPTAD